MKKTLLTKGISFAVIALFVITMILPATGRTMDKNNVSLLDKEIIVNNDVVKEFLRPQGVRFCNNNYKIDSENHLGIMKGKPQASTVQANNDIYFTYPLNNDVLRTGDTIIINGTIKGEKFKYYTIKYGKGRIPIIWYTTGITLTDDGESSIENDTVAIWDTSHITEPGFFTLKITTHFERTSNAQFREKFKSFLPRHHPLSTLLSFKGDDATLSFLDEKVKTYIKNIYLDPTLKEGWPQRIEKDEYSGGHVWPGLVESVVRDINNDGDMELVVYKGGNLPKIYAFNQDGTMVEGWPAVVDDIVLPGGNIGAPTIADVDNDGYQEIFVNGYEGIYIFNHNGSFLRKIKQKNSCEPSWSQECVVYDLDNDGSMEIVKKYLSEEPKVGRYGVKLTVFDIYGNVLSGWPQMIYDYKGQPGAGEEGMPAIGNFDDDSDLEIVVATNRYSDGTSHIRGRIIVYNLNGSILNGFPLDIDRWCPSPAPAIGDVNNDGEDEIVAAASKGIYVIDRYGNNCTGWPQLMDKKISASPALADFDNDGYLEIVISKMGDPYETYVFDYQGNVLSGWPQQTSWNDYRAPIVGDVNGDGNPDVVTTAGNGVVPWSSEDGGVYAWNFDGSLIDGFPKVTENDAQGSATISDIDNDGRVEIIASSNWDEDIETHKNKHRVTIYVWELDSEFNQETMEWPMFHHDTMHTGYYVPIGRSNFLEEDQSTYSKFLERILSLPVFNRMLLR